MSQDFAVSLDVRNSEQSEPGWVNVVASNGAKYGYRYTGGADGSGNVVEQGRGSAAITVNLIADPNYYEINDVAFADDPLAQLSKQSLLARAVVITDKNDQIESNAYYSIIVRDKVANCTLLCDPRVSNTN